MKAELNHIELANICDVIISHMGLQFPKERWDMLRRNLSMAATEFGFQEVRDFTDWILTSKLTTNDIKILASYITVSESYFWREPEVFNALTDFILPELFASKKDGDKKIRIWSAGCSTGEEAYSLAIALHEALPNIKKQEILILATDLNPKVLSKAKAGIYTQWSFRNCPTWFKSRYFKQIEEGKFVVIPKIKKMVTFESLNLIDDVYPSLSNNSHSMDIIFCRNVLMYFTDEWIDKISQKFYQSLNKDGWFVVASCELNSQRFLQYKPVNFRGSVLYRKGDTDFSIPKTIFTRPIVTNFDIPDYTHQKTDPDAFQPLFAPITDTSPIPVNNFVIETVADKIIVQINEEPIIQHAVEANANETSLIRKLANQGNLAEALSLCEALIATHKLDTACYFLRATILQELDKIPEAIKSLKQAIFLDSDFIMGHFALGNLYLKQNSTQLAKKQFNYVLDILSTYNQEDILPESEGLSVKYLSEIIFENMQTLNRL